MQKARFIEECRDAREHFHRHIFIMSAAGLGKHLALFAPSGPITTQQILFDCRADRLLEGHRVILLRGRRREFEVALQRPVVQLIREVKALDEPTAIL